MYLPSFAVPQGMTNVVGTDPVWHLLRCIAYGQTPQLAAQVRWAGATSNTGQLAVVYAVRQPSGTRSPFKSRREPERAAPGFTRTPLGW